MSIAEWVEIAANLATIGAIVVGGVWTYTLFVRQRLKYPRAELEITHAHVALPTGLRLLHCALKIRNTGNVLLRPTLVQLRIRQVIPIDASIATRFASGVDPVLHGRHELEWPLLVQREWTDAPHIEPGESDTLHADFVIDDVVECVQLYGYVSNPTHPRPDQGWPVTEFLWLRGDSTMVPKDERRSDELIERQQGRQEEQEPRQQQLHPPQTPKLQGPVDAGSEEQAAQQTPPKAND